MLNFSQVWMIGKMIGDPVIFVLSFILSDFWHFQPLLRHSVTLPLLLSNRYDRSDEHPRPIYTTKLLFPLLSTNKVYRFTPCPFYFCSLTSSFINVNIINVNNVNLCSRLTYSSFVIKWSFFRLINSTIDFLHNDVGIMRLAHSILKQTYFLCFTILTNCKW
jgi:hypothetical protein